LILFLKKRLSERHEDIKKDGAIQLIFEEDKQTWEDRKAYRTVGK